MTQNLIMLPSGNAGKKFINLLTLWIEKFNKKTTFKGIAIKVFMILPALMLQKSAHNSKT